MGSSGGYDNAMKIYEGMLTGHLYLGKELWSKR